MSTALQLDSLTEAARRAKLKLIHAQHHGKVSSAVAREPTPQEIAEAQDEIDAEMEQERGLAIFFMLMEEENNE